MSIQSCAEPAAGLRGTPFAPGLFDQQTVVVTGGTSGIGAATAACFHTLGAEVIAVGLNAAEAPIAQAERLQLVDCDVTDQAACAALISSLPRIDHLVLCAGISLNEDEYGLDGFRRVVEVNLIAGMAMAMLAAPVLSACKGSIVLTGSMYSYFGGGERPGYAASKGGVAQLTKSLAQHFAPQGVRVNAVAPGWIETPLAKNLDTATRARILQRIPLNRWGESDEVAQTIAFLCSPAASYITGAILPVDGGYLTA